VAGLDDDRLRPGPVEAVGARSDRLEGDRGADLAGERGQRLEPRRELVAVDLSRRGRVERRRLGGRGKFLDLGAILSRDSSGAPPTFELADGCWLVE
jgi:hypothetical protein